MGMKAFYASDILDDHGWRFLFIVLMLVFICFLLGDGTETKVLQK
jgi:hypothetical protein